jgi:hypothetical protein
MMDAQPGFIQSIAFIRKEDTKAGEKAPHGCFPQSS